MRWIIVSLLIFAMVFSAGVSYGKEDKKPNAAYGLARGITNISTGWIEFPRCLVYENVRIPMVGLVFGSIEGVGYTIWRTALGVTDLVTLGLTGDLLYSDAMPDFVWQADWFPKDK